MKCSDNVLTSQRQMRVKLTFEKLIRRECFWSEKMFEAPDTSDQQMADLLPSYEERLKACTK